MSRLLGLLRKEGEGLALAPRPTLAHVDALVVDRVPACAGK